MGLLTASSATGQLALFPLATWMAETYGWRSAVLPSGIACAVAGVLVMLFACDHPAQLGLPAVGERIVAAIPPRRGGAATIAISALREASATRSFWLLFGTFFVCGLSTNGLIQHHFIPLCSDYGMVPLQAAWVLTMMGLCDFIGTIGSGWLSDRYDSRLLLCWYYGLRGLSLMVLPFSTFSIPGLTLFAVFYGLDWDRYGAADRQAGSCELWTAACAGGVRLDLSGPPAGCGDGRRGRRSLQGAAGRAICRPSSSRVWLACSRRRIAADPPPQTASDVGSVDSRRRPRARLISAEETARTRGGAEGATAPETLRQQDRRRVVNSEKRGARLRRWCKMSPDPRATSMLSGR